MKLYLDSSNATNNVFKLDEKINGKWKLLSFCSTNNIFNVNSTNNQIYLFEDGSDKIAVINPGNYDFNSLKTAITTALNAVATGTFSVTTDDNTNKLTFTNTTNFHFTFASNTTNSANKILGMNQSDGTNALSHESDQPIDLNTYKDIFVNILENDDQDIVGQSFFKSSLIIYGTGMFGEILRYINEDNFDQFVKFSKNTKTITVNFHDLNNNNVDLNSDYAIIFEKI